MTPRIINSLKFAPVDDAQKSDEALAVAARAGCGQSFDLLARRFQVRLLRFLQRRVRCAADAEDLLQETFARVYEQLDRYDESRRFGTWLFTIAHRLAVSHHRHQGAMARADQNGMRDSRRSEPAQPLRLIVEEEQRQRFWEIARAALSEEQLAATWLYYVEQMPAPQIAEVMGRSWVSVKTMLFRARRRLMPLLADSAPQGSVDLPKAPRVPKSSRLALAT